MNLKELVRVGAIFNSQYRYIIEGLDSKELATQLFSSLLEKQNK